MLFLLLEKETARSRSEAWHQINLDTVDILALTLNGWPAHLIWAGQHRHDRGRDVG